MNVTADAMSIQNCLTKRYCHIGKILQRGENHAKLPEELLPHPDGGNLSLLTLSFVPSTQASHPCDKKRYLMGVCARDGHADAANAE